MYVYWQKDVWNFIACIVYEGGELFDNFTFYISCLDCDMIVSFQDDSELLISHAFSTWMFHMAYKPNIAGCPICFNYYIFTVYKMCICT